MINGMKEVYLCGPIKNCTWEQKTEWRERLKKKYGDVVVFHDPMEFEFQEAIDVNVLVETDIEHIRKSDIIVVNLWKLSIGTIMELVYAKTMGKKVLVLTERQYISPWLIYHSSKIVQSETEFFEAFCDILREGK